MTLALPEDKCKQRCPRYGRRTLLHVESKPEDDPSLPFMVRPSASSCAIVLHTEQQHACLDTFQGLLACKISCSHMVIPLSSARFTHRTMHVYGWVSLKFLPDAGAAGQASTRQSDQKQRRRRA